MTRDRTTCWAFLRTMAPDYGKNGYPLRKLGPGHAPHLLYFLCQPGTSERPGGPVLFRSRRAAIEYARADKEHGRPVRVRVTVEAVSR